MGSASGAQSQPAMKMVDPTLQPGTVPGSDQNLDRARDRIGMSWKGDGEMLCQVKLSLGCAHGGRQAPPKEIHLLYFKTLRNASRGSVFCIIERLQHCCHEYMLKDMTL